MATAERSLTVATPLADVWEALADFGSISAWAPNVDHSCLMTEQRDGVGAQRRIQSGRLTLVETVLEWEPEAQLTYSITGMPRVLKAVTSTWRVSMAGAGTIITLSNDVDAGNRPPQKAIARLATRRLQSVADDMLGGLAAHVTNGSSS